MQEASSGRLRHKTREEKDGRRMKLCRQRYKRYEVVEAKIVEVSSCQGKDRRDIKAPRDMKDRRHIKASR